ncbi:amino acid ABC transporter substrate-binding protein [Blastococcus sp. TF02A-35]|uniref:ABC transporter substrate-binding protein n=1 Tax=Blastococcus sp. TF02A-35 TaxID=2559612 RepID=UPI001073EBD8|nr:amino acid ABC transporter substrate-binding protein [Blastococcus sp. TF02A_35]TFV52892.1 amino acid ABC transporter substrate-binding protein [Blastococcus sp. TF02A_35]
MRRSLICLAAVAVVTSGCTSDEAAPDGEDFQPAPAPTVELDLLGDLASPLTVGLVVTGSGPRGEGAEFAAPAAGARVAEFRLDGDEDRLQLEVVDDRGTTEGAVAATQQLLDAGVAGIVYASAGAHLDAALDLASGAGTAVLLPYDTRDDLAAETAWRTGPSDQQVGDVVGAMLSGRGQRTPVAFTGEGTGQGLAALAQADRRVTIAAGDALAGQVAAAAQPLVDGAADSVLVSASAETAAETVAALQGTAPTAPVVLGPSALTPAFAARLRDLGSAGGATTAGQFFTVGPAASDASTDEGAVRFLDAVRLAAQDADLQSLSGTDAFGRLGAATADVRSHDAVLALAAAAAGAGSTEPGAVLGALRGLELGADDGLAGPALAFADQQALTDAGVAVLQATTRGAERGVEQDAPALSWFVLPDGEG